MKYSININLKGYKNVELGKNGLENETVVVYIDKSCEDEKVQYYTYVKELLRNSNTLILIYKEDGNSIYKLLSMLMCMFGQYSIYKDTGFINSDYIDVLLEREPDTQEVEMFLGADIVAYDEFQPILLSITNKLAKNEYESALKEIEKNRGLFEGYIQLTTYMKAIIEQCRVDEVGKKLKENETSKLKLKEQLDSANKKIKTCEAEVEQYKESSLECTKISEQAKKKVAELERKLNSSAPVIRAYTPVNTTLFDCKVKNIIYFKEVSPIRYINSFLTQYYNYLVKVLKLNVKLMIYDNATSFVDVYKPMQVITSTEYLSNRENIVNKLKKMVIVEANQSIMEDILRNEKVDVVLVYDRLKLLDDLVVGNNITKLWVLNSTTEYQRLKDKCAIQLKNILTNPELSPESLCISPIVEYKAQTDSKKLFSYIQMENEGKELGTLFNIITERAHIGQLK